jgi:hypothetical protein
MDIRHAKYLLPFVLAATSAGFSPTGIADEARTRPIKLSGLRILSPYRPVIPGSSQLDSEAAAIPHPSLAAPQRVEQKEERPSPIAAAPGSDSTRFVPGTSVGSFNQAGAFSVGRILIKPSAVISYAYESNLQGLSTGYQPDNTFLVSPTIEVFLPFTRNGIRFDYSMLYRNYQRIQLTRNVDHVFNTDSSFDLTPILSLAVRNRFSVSAVDSREFTPGREVIFSDSPFRRNDLGIQMNWTISENDSLGFSSNWNHVFFSQRADAGSAPFYDFDQYGFAGTYRRDVSERLGIVAGGGYRQSLTNDPRNISNSKGFEVTGGIDGAVTPLITGQFTVGASFDSYPGSLTNTARSLIFRGGFAKEISERSQASVSLSRASNLSNFQQNPYFVSTGIGGSYSRELKPDMTLLLSSSYQRNGYPLQLQAGPAIPGDMVGIKRRQDSFVDIGFGLRYRYNDWLAMDLHFDATRRNSDIPGFRFNSYRGGINFLIGSRGSAIGRLPY